MSTDHCGSEVVPAPFSKAAHCPRAGLMIGGDRLVRRDEEVPVAVQVGIAHGERALKVGPHEVLTQDLHGPLGELDQHDIELRVPSGHRVHPRLKRNGTKPCARATGNGFPVSRSAGQPVSRSDGQMGKG